MLVKINDKLAPKASFFIGMSKKVKLTKKEVEQIAELSKLKLTESQIQKFRPQLTSILGYVSKIQSLETENTKETSQTTGLENVYRKDKIEKNKVLSQKDALSNAKRKRNGYFLVDSVLE